MSTATKGLLEKDKLSLQGFYAFSSHMTLDLLALRTWWQQWLPLRHGLDAFFPHQARAEGECRFPVIPLGRALTSQFCPHHCVIPPGGMLTQACLSPYSTSRSKSDLFLRGPCGSTLCSCAALWSTCIPGV